MSRRWLPVLAGLLLAGCGGGSTAQDGATRPAPTLPPESASERAAAQLALAEEQRATTTSTGTTGTSAPGGATEPAVALSPADRRSFAALERELGGRSGVAVARVGGATTVSSAGTLKSGVAWSSIKVPIVVAVTREDGGVLSEAHRTLARRALTASDNAAAAQLWDDLGDQAGARTGTVLADAGAPEVVVQTRTTRSGLSPFGQTMWSVTDQAQVAAALPCADGADTALVLMSEVRADQRWGLGTLGTTARFKGGWGPGLDGAYLVRQLGLVRVPGGQLAVAIATRPADGAFPTGTANLTKLAAWVRDNVRGATPAPC